MKTYNLYLDDVRAPVDSYGYTSNQYYLNSDWVVVRTYDEFVNRIEDGLKEEEFPAIVSFDHDLADEHYDPTMYKGLSAYEKAAKNFIEKTGLECSKWLVQFCIDNDISMPICLIHSMNPAGSERIKQSIADYDRYMKAIDRNR
jgi:hypothetical protein